MYMKKNIYGLTGFVLAMAIVVFVSCTKEDKLVKEEPVDFLELPQNAVKNGLDSLIDTIQRDYGVKVYYQFTPRVIDPTTFFTPTSYDRAVSYTNIMINKLWLGPLKQRFPKFWANEKPIEFLIVGSAIKFNSISSGGAAGAGLNGQFYRLGMGAVDNLSFTNKTSLRSHITTLYHEHAHQMDHKYGRGYAYDRVSQGNYYGIAYSSKTTAQAQADGFFEPYGGYAPEEDFATTVGACLTFTKDSVLRIVAKNPKLKTKYEMIYQKYLNMGMDLHDMKTYLDSAVARL
jgi:substrate import-associated zinc metallohydrolase lipoprotein